MLLIGVVVSHGLSACVDHPLETRIEPSHSMGGNTLEVLIALAQRHGICLGIEGTVGLRPAITVSAEPVTFGGLLPSMAPRHRITVSKRVIIIRDQPRTTRTWLDYPLDFSTGRRLDAQLLVNVLLPGALLARAGPKARGIAGDFRPGHEELGPYHFTKTPVRAILNQFLRDSIQGGMWFVRGVYPLNPVAPVNLCELVLYSEPLANVPARF
jgi:hypothetical protein